MMLIEREIMMMIMDNITGDEDVNSYENTIDHHHFLFKSTIHL
jgi:hypothetical protein